MDDEQSLLNEPEPEPRPNAAAEAFARLDGRIAMMARAVEHLAAERASIDIPDYSGTLGQMSTRLAAVAQGLAAIADKPAMQLTPEGLAARMDTAAKASRADDRSTLQEAREAHQEAARIIHSLVRTVSSARAQRRHLIWAASGGLVAGCLLWSILPGAVLRALPTSWHMPERMAVHIMNEPTLRRAGVRLMSTANADEWRAITTAAQIWDDNRDEIQSCEKNARNAQKSEKCTIIIRNSPP